MDCKDCHVEMVCRPRMDLTYHECPQCGGLWFNGGELESLIEQRIAIRVGATRPDAPSAVESNACPACGDGARLVSMTAYATRRVKTLGCPVCFGHWMSGDQGRDLVRLVCYSGLWGWLRRIGECVKILSPNRP